MRKDERLICVFGAAQIELSARSAYWWTGAEGLDGLDNNVYTIKGAGQDGETFVAQNLQPRIITVEGQVRRDIVANRENLLRKINPKTTGRLVYKRGNVVRHIPCYVRTAPRFGADGIYPQFLFDVIAPDPYWRDGDGATTPSVPIAAWLPLWEFDIEIPLDGMEFERRADSMIVNVRNGGAIETGMRAVITATAAVSNPVLVNVLTQERFGVNVDMEAGDVLEINTGYHNKRTTLNGANVFNLIDFGADGFAWLQLRAGDNPIRCTASNDDAITARIYFDVLHLGV